MSQAPPKLPVTPNIEPEPDVLEIQSIDEILPVDAVQEIPELLGGPIDVPFDLGVPIDMPGIEVETPPPEPLDDLPPLEMDSPSGAASQPSPLLTPMAAPAPPEPIDLPAQDGPALDFGLEMSPPSLMDELPAEVLSNGLGDQAYQALEIDMAPAAAPRRNDSAAVDLAELPDLADAPPIDMLTAAAPVHPPTQTPATPRKRRGVMLAAAGVVGLGLVAAALLATPLGGLVGLKPAAQVAVKAPKPAQQTTKAPAPPPPAVVRAPLEKLTRETVDTLGYAALSAGSATLAARPAAGEARGLLLWARFRLATAFGDEPARQALLTSLAEKNEPKPHPLSLVAAAGAAVLWGRPLPQKAALGRLKGPAQKQPQALYVEALMHSRKKGGSVKALAVLGRLAQQAPSMPDPQLLRAELLTARPDPRDGVLAYLGMAQRGDPDTALRAAEALLRAEQYAAVEEAVAGIDSTKVVDAAPSLQDAYRRLQVRRHLMRGDTAAALQAAQQRAQAQADNVAAVIEWARLAHYSGQDGAKIALEAAVKLTRPQARARAYYEGVVLALQQKNAAAAEETYKLAMRLPEASCGGWLKMLEGAMAENGGDTARARLAYVAAVKLQPSLEEARLAEARLAGTQDAAAIIKPTRGFPQPALQNQLAATLSQKGDFAGAAKLLQAVLWSDPTVGEPMALLLRYIGAVDASGEALRAQTLAEAVAQVRPDDDRPIQQIIDMARRGKRLADVAKWYQVLLQRHPNHRAYSVALANAYIDNRQNEAALKVLEALAKADPEARDEEFLFTEGRAWGSADVVKARGFLQASLKAKPHPRAYILLGELEQERGKNDEALAAYREALVLDPQQPAIRLRLSKLLITKGFTKEAIGELSTVLEKSPRDLEAAELLGDALREQGDTAAAMQAYEKAELAHPEAGPHLVGLLMKMGRLQLQELGKVSEALGTLRRVIKIDAKMAEAHYYAGLALRDLGRAAAGRAELQTYLQLAPQGEFAKEVRQDLGE